MVVDEARAQRFVERVEEARAAGTPLAPYRPPARVSAPRRAHKSMTPERSMAQRMGALAHANEIRSQRATLKRDLMAGRKSIRDVLLEPPEYVETMKVFDALLACRTFGRVKVNKVLMHARISPSKTIGGLSVRQRTELASMIRR